MNYCKNWGEKFIKIKIITKLQNNFLQNFSRNDNGYNHFNPKL